MSKRRDTRWSDDSGVALITVMGVIVVITLLAVGSYNIAGQALTESGNVASETAAYRVAASGLDKEIAIFQEGGVTAGDYPKETMTSEGTATITIEGPDELGPMKYRLTSTGKSADGGAETVAQEFYFMEMWKMNISADAGFGASNGASSICGPIYCRGDFDITGGTRFVEGPLFVQGGDVNYDGGFFGTNDLKIDVFCTGSTASLFKNGRPINNAPVGNISDVVPDIVMPTLTAADLAAYATTAKAESVDNVMGSNVTSPVEVFEASLSDPQATDYIDTAYTSLHSTSGRLRAKPNNASVPINACYKFIGAPEGIAAKGAGTYDFTLRGGNKSYSFGWWGPTKKGSVTVAGSSPTGVYGQNVHDDFAWDAVNRILYIEGTVFIDGDVTFDTDVTYVGNGTIVANGDIVANGYLKPAGTSQQARDNKWSLGLVTPTSITFTRGSSNAMGGHPTPEQLRNRPPEVAGAFFAEEYVQLADKLEVQGSIVTGDLRVPKGHAWLITNPLLPDYVPSSMPGAGGGLVSPARWIRY